MSRNAQNVCVASRKATMVIHENTGNSVWVCVKIKSLNQQTQ